ncbi:hypothetical protein [Saccharopolyspora taberi]|uniref:Uncharacterized protein n=1 Tax=Saccharopolyspora taberi TaxID=60895 RepID=A0ABN3VJL5_9PSEU
MAAEKEHTARPGSREVAAATAFVRDHGKSARAVVENLGQAGARVVLIGADGALGDVMVADVATGEALVEAVGELTASEWDGETTGALKIGAAHRRKMAGPRAR